MRDAPRILDADYGPALRRSRSWRHCARPEPPPRPTAGCPSCRLRPAQNTDRFLPGTIRARHYPRECPPLFSVPGVAHRPAGAGHLTAGRRPGRGETELFDRFQRSACRVMIATEQILPLRQPRDQQLLASTHEVPLMKGGAKWRQSRTLPWARKLSAARAVLWSWRAGRTGRWVLFITRWRRSLRRRRGPGPTA